MNTPLSSGPITYYFRTEFVFAGNLSQAAFPVRLLVDDGAIGYLNGVEVFRVNMPEGPVNAATLANSPVGNADFGASLFLPTASLRTGANLLAVEVHQTPRFSGYSGAVLGSGPVGYWRLGENGGTVMDAASAAGPPQSGAQNGAFMNMLSANLAQPGPRPTDTVGGQLLRGFEADNAAPRFAGTGDGANDVVTIADPGVFNFAASRQFTLEAWVNAPASQVSGAPVICKGTGGGGEQYCLDVVDGRYRFYGWLSGGGSYFMVNPSVGPNGTWQHVAAVYDQPANRIKLYLNGAEVGSTTPPASMVSTAHDVSIGSRQSGSGAYDLNFNGRIDEVAIFNRALSTNEIRAHLNAAFSNSAPAGFDTNDAAFGLELAATQTLPVSSAASVVFNEFSSCTNAAFWVELINSGGADAGLGGCILVRLGGATNQQYVLPSSTLAPGALLQITRAELGFGADPGDVLALYSPDGQQVLDAIVAKREPRARHPDGTGRWLFPAALTPGASNHFEFHRELVINEIMYHHRELPAEPATFAPTNQLVLISNAWKYHAGGLNLGEAWRAPGYNDSAWLEGAAMFHAPSNISLPAPKNTRLSLTNSAGARIITYYFRTQFMFSGDTNELLLMLRPLIDDGAVFYLNGAETARINMPATNILYGTLAATNVGVPTYQPVLYLPLTNLAQGWNTLAVEVHQYTTNNSDVAFGCELAATRQLTEALPFRDSPESWVEIFNQSTSTVSLAGWRLDEGIDYRFAGNQSLVPGGYLVVAKDTAYMRALHPGLDVVGPFTNKLSRSGDLVVLKDPQNNPASEVRYFDGGRWPEYADGGGSSLELRDPRADLMAAEAWAASDESGKSSWQTYAWRGISQAGQPGEPTLWHELALCLLDGAGEVLLDDISVVETPAGTPKQLIQNGAFAGGSAEHWRFLGTHRHSRVEPEPGQPGNFVLHLRASAYGEYQGNQIETTLTNNVSIVDGREYEISFRAKWLAGKSLLNTRLYFNRLPRTVQLAVPERNGTPGAPNSLSIDNLGPTCQSLSHQPVVPNPGQPVTVSVEASDPDGVESLDLWYSVSGGTWKRVAMSDTVPSSASIPGQPAASVVQFYVEGADTRGAVSMFPAGGTNSRALYRVQDNQAGGGPLRNFRIIMTPADAAFLHTGTNTLSNELLGCTVVDNEGEVFYDAGVRLKGSFVGRNVDRVGFHVQFQPDRLFRGVHPKVSVDRSQHTAIGGIGEILAKHLAGHAGRMPNMYDDLARFIAPLPSYTSMSALRLAGFDEEYLDSQYPSGSEGPMYEPEVIRWMLNTVDGRPESPKAPGNEGGGTGWVGYDLQSYGDNPESYRWTFPLLLNRTTADLSAPMAVCQTFSLAGTNLAARSEQVLDVDEWLRVLAFQVLIGPADAYYTGGTYHNYRLYRRPGDGRTLYMPWDWDSAFMASASAPLVASYNVTKLINLSGNYRRYLNHLYDLVTTTFNTAYASPWASRYSALSGQDFSGVLGYIGSRASYVLGQLPTATAFAITNHAGNNFTVTNGLALLAGTAPISVYQIEANGTAYPVTWLSTTHWTVAIPLSAGANSMLLRGLDQRGLALANAADSITVTNTGPAGILPVIINEWMADNKGPGGLTDPADNLFSDWFELFNPNSYAANISGLYLTDSLDQPAQWLIPTNCFISAGGFLLVWADGHTNQNPVFGGTNIDLHAGFQLGAGGETIGLFASDGVTPISVVTFARQTQNVSQGYFPDGDTNVVHSMTNWTPRAANTLASLSQPRILSLVQSDGTLALGCAAVPGRVYQLQFKDDLAMAFWTPIPQAFAERAGDGGVLMNAPLDVAAPHRFYRVVLLP